MKHTFLLGAVSGMTALVIAVPLAAPLTNAASGISSSATTVTGDRGSNFSVDKIDDMIRRDQAFLDNADALLAIAKTATEKHKNALVAAQSLTDPAARKNAVRQAHEDMRNTLKMAIEANPDLKGIMMHFLPHGGKRGMMRGPTGGMPAMTPHS